MDKDFTLIYQEMANEIMGILNKYNLDPFSFTYTTSEKHPQAHNEILECLASHIKDGDEKKIIFAENKKAFENYIIEAVDRNDYDKWAPEQGVQKLIATYLDVFYGPYFLIIDNEIKLTKKEFFDLPCKKTRSFEEFDKNEKYISKTAFHPDDKSMRVDVEFKEVIDDICKLEIWYNRKCYVNLEAWFFESVYDFTKDELRKNRIDFRDSVTNNILYSFVWVR